ncbi:MAG: class I SAM-dependent methyltransferase [Thermoplasmata archaeon]
MRRGDVAPGPLNPRGESGASQSPNSRSSLPYEAETCWEIGCGTAYVSAWLARRGARVVGVDNSPGQLARARRFQSDFGLAFPLIHGIAEALPFPDESFDLAISEYGAAIWSDPHRWIPEASRVLRPKGELIFLVNGTLLMLCVPDEDEVAAGDRLLRDYFGMYRFDNDVESVEFHLGYGA